jgi:hypothetical protein
MNLKFDEFRLLNLSGISLNIYKIVSVGYSDNYEDKKSA